MMKQKEEILYAIKEVIAQVMPTGARVVLFGSQARNDAREDSDWDILILLDKEKSIYPNPNPRGHRRGNAQTTTRTNCFLARIAFMEKYEVDYSESSYFVF